MADRKSTQILRAYYRKLGKIHATGQATEHSYRVITKSGVQSDLKKSGVSG